MTLYLGGIQREPGFPSPSLYRLYSFGSYKDMVLSDDLMKDKTISKGCINTRKLIIKYSIPSSEVAYAMYVKSKNAYQVSSASNNKAKVFITYKCVMDTFKTNVTESPNETNETTINKQKVYPLPPLLVLNEEEKLKDMNGNSLEIEVRGERSYDKCFFKVKDIANGFKILKLLDTVIHHNSGYELNTHYVFYYTGNKRIARDSIDNSINRIDSPIEQNVKIEKSEMYFTYCGLIRCLFVSRNPNAERFQEWAMKILFAHQMGTMEQKIDVTSKCLGVSTDELQRVLSKSVDPVSCVYVFSLGTVKDLRNVMNIDDSYADDLYVVKYGRTIDLIRRTKEHDKMYGNIPNVSLELAHFLYVDPDMCVQAENMLKEYFEDSSIAYKQTKEIAILNKNELKHIYDRFLHIKDKCCQKVQTLNEHIKKLQEELKTKERFMNLIEKNHVMELEKMQMQMKLMEKNHEMENMHLQMKLDAELEINKLRLENMELKYKQGNPGSL